MTGDKILAMLLVALLPYLIATALIVGLAAAIYVVIKRRGEW